MIQAKITAIANALIAGGAPTAVTVYHDVDSTGYVEDDYHWTLADIQTLLSPLPNVLYEDGGQFYTGGS